MDYNGPSTNFYPPVNDVSYLVFIKSLCPSNAIIGCLLSFSYTQEIQNDNTVFEIIYP